MEISNKYGLFKGEGQRNRNSKETKQKDVDIEKLIQMQTEILMNKYNVSCLDVKQLQEVLNVGESNIYEMLKKKELPFREIGRRKVIPAIALATYLVLGRNIEKIS